MKAPTLWVSIVQPDDEPLLYRYIDGNCADANVASEEDILAQPCVVEALRKARESGWDDACDEAGKRIDAKRGGWPAGTDPEWLRGWDCAVAATSLTLIAMSERCPLKAPT